LQSVPDREPPRSLVFEVEQRTQSRSWLWGWASPALAAVAASILTAVLMSPSVAESPDAAQSWLAAELDKRDQAHNQDLLRLRTELTLLESRQRLATRDTLETARNIQLLATKLPPGE
jgi:hypothetical protein